MNKEEILTAAVNDLNKVLQSLETAVEEAKFRRKLIVKEANEKFEELNSPPDEESVEEPAE